MTLGELAEKAADGFISLLSSPTGLIALAAAAVAISFVVVGALVRTMIPLRWLAVGANAGFLVFGAMHPSPITFVVALVLLPVNVWRAVEMMKLTHRVKRAVGQADLSGVWLKPYMWKKQLDAGTTLFSKGDLADHLYILVEGRMELTDIGAPIEPGKIFGEIAFFSPNRRRTHTARCIEGCTVLMIDETTVRQLYYQNPSFGFHLMGLVAGRLSSDVERMEKLLAAAKAPAAG